MGEITFIKDGLAKTIHDDGSISTTPLDQCDQCHEWQSTGGGLSIRDVGLEVVIWVCSECRV